MDDLTSGWRGNYHEFALRLGTDVLDPNPRLAESAVSLLGRFGVLPAPTADALVQALDALPRVVHWKPGAYAGP